MKEKYSILIVLGIVAASLLAFLVRSTVYTTIILPLARLFWLIQGYYGAFPQTVYWVIALLLGALLVAIGFKLPEWGKRSHLEQWKPLPGHVQELSFWIQRAKTGSYPKWHVARLLGELALDILDLRGKREKHILLNQGREWAPPENVKKYLDEALNSNYSDYTRLKKLKSKSPALFDPNLDPVIEYLESLMELENDHNF